MSRQTFEFEEPSANVTINIDVARKPRKSIARDTPRDLPRTCELLRLISVYLERSATAVAA
jgi:hypothetical protein